ncbi:MAG: iron-containing alcohol dehydrogenase [Candidatus Eisenbacteria bacterium]|nr:iron-containing alcohol dehydrogenase [Candidatus Eisenbacteria bacterium]
MDNFEFYLPTRIIFGAGEIGRIGEEARTLGKKAIVVTGRKSTKETGLLKKVLSLLKKEGVEAIVFDKIEPNPRTSTVNEAGILAHEKKVEMVIGLGGGSPMDAAKAIAVAALDPGDIWRYIRTGKEKPYIRPEKALPIILVPTLAATGSEADSGGVITNWETKEKAIIGGECLFPRISIVDPELTFTVNEEYARDGGIDIIVHVLESYLNGTAEAPFQDRVTEGLILTVMENLPLCVTNPKNLDARANLSWCSAIALCGFPSAGREGAFPVHCIQHSLSAHYDISHGAGLGIILPNWMEYCCRARPRKFAQLGRRVFGIGSAKKKDLDIALETVKAVRKWIKQNGSAWRLKDIGIDSSKFTRMAEDAVRIYGRDGFLGGAKRLSVKDIVSIYEMSL